LLANRFIFETEKHNGIAELLEILGRLVPAAAVNVHHALKSAVV